MSLGVVIKGPEGVVLACDSRITLQAQKPGGPLFPVNFDNATKLLSFGPPNRWVGAVTYGIAVIGLRTAHSFIPEFELTLAQEDRLKVLDFSKRLSDFFMKQWDQTVADGAIPHDYAGPGMVFIVGGYDPDSAYGKVFLFEIPGQPEPQPRNPGEKDFGITWGGQLEIASRILHGYDPSLISILRDKLSLDEQQIAEATQILQRQLEFPIPYSVLPLQDCVDLAAFLVRSTMQVQSLALGIRGVGGPVDVAVITRTGGLKYVQKKSLRGESGSRHQEDSEDETNR